MELSDFLLRHPNAWLAALVESSDDAIIGKTLDSVVRSWNEGARRIFGYAPEEVIGQSILLLIPPELREEETVIVSRLRQGERVDHFETIRLRKGGEPVEVSLSVSPIREPGGDIVGAAKIAREISEAKRLQRVERDLTENLQHLAAELEQQLEEGQSLQAELEETNERLAAALAEAQRAKLEAEEQRRGADRANAAKSEFLAMMSHELRTPLNSITGYAELLEIELHGELTAEQRMYVKRLQRSQLTLRRLIEDVLNFAKIEAGRIELHVVPVKVNELLAGLEQFIAPNLERKGLGFQVNLCVDDPTIPFDRERVEQILLNLLSNAVKFTTEGHIEVTCTLDRATIGFQVRDTGAGVAPDRLNVIFDPFVQGDSSLTRTAEGTGLGLAISRQLARAMDGDVSVESEMGRGSTFTLRLPRA